MPFPLMYEQQFEIATDGTGTTFAPVASGISQAEIANNEELDQTPYLDEGGFKSTDVIGAQMTVNFTGHREYGDAAQDYIFGKALTLGSARRTQFKYTAANGDIYEGDCTIANISGPSGEAAAKSEISFAIHFNGLPQFTAGA